MNDAPRQRWWQSTTGLLKAGAAFVTAVAGLLAALHQTGLLGNGAEETPEERNRGGARLVIEGVDLFGPLAGGEVQVRAFVNGTEYRYPSVGGIEWVEVGPDMSSQQFSLPSTERAYEIRFEMTVKRDGELFEMISQSTERARPHDLPIRGAYELHRRQGPVRSAAVEAQIRFRVERA